MVNTRPRIGGSGALLKMSAVIGTSVETSISNYTTIGEVLTISPSLECAEVDVTSLNSGTVREFIPGHLSGTLSATLYLHQLDSTAATSNWDSLELLNAYQGREHRGWAIVIPLEDKSAITAADETQTWIFPGFITGYSANIDNGDNAMTVDLGIRISDSTIIDSTPA